MNSKNLFLYEVKCIQKKFWGGFIIKTLLYSMFFEAEKYMLWYLLVYMEMTLRYMSLSKFFEFCDVSKYIFPYFESIICENTFKNYFFDYTS